MEKDPETFKLEIRNEDRGVFVDFKPQLVVLGPRSSDLKEGADDHVTVVMDGDRVDQAHRKVDGRELWHHTGEHLQAELDSLLANATTRLDLDKLRKPNTYVLSARRVKLIFQVVTLPISISLRLFWRLVATLEVSGNQKGKSARIVFEERKIRHLIRRARRPAALISRLLAKIPQKVFLRLTRFFAKRVLVNLQSVDGLKDDVWFVVSSDHIGLAFPSDDDEVRFISAAPLFDALLRAQASLPVSLDDLKDIGPGTEFRVKAGFNPSSSL